MHRWAQILCLLVGVSFVLAPLGRVHAHVTDTEQQHDHVSVHGGHDHGIADDHHEEHEQHNGALHDHQDSGAQVLDMQLDASQRLW